MITAVLPVLVIVALIFVLADVGQKYFVLRLFRETKDEKEREALLAMMTRRRY
ncbi:MAG: hypothetical protein WHV66_02695 [Anaerolineales bacterium]